MADSLTAVRARLKQLGDPVRAEHSKGFFKTGKGEYAEGDRFLGCKVPDLRKEARAQRDLPMTAVRSLLKSPVHEERFFALLLLVQRFQRGDEKEKKAVYDMYLSSTKFVNNWDLVDCSAHKIVGAWLLDRSTAPLDKLAKSENLWERRIAMIATMAFLRASEVKTTQRIATHLLNDEHDLIHKAVGWMLREMGKVDLRAEEAFLKTRYKKMPRTMLRYAIERFPEARRKRYLEGMIA